MTENLMTATFVATLIPAAIMLGLMLRTTWWSIDGRPNHGGRIVVGILFAFVAATATSVVALLLPEWAQEDVAMWMRISVRLIGASVMWLLLLTYLGVQRRGRAEARHEGQAAR